jgi:hypothetical protein
MDANNEKPLTWRPDKTQASEYKDLVMQPGEAVEDAKARREGLVRRKALNSKRKIVATATRAIPFAGIEEVRRGNREEFLKTEEGKERVLMAINNMNAIGKLDDVEAKKAAEEFGVAFIPLQERIDAIR